MQSSKGPVVGKKEVRILPWVWQSRETSPNFIGGKAAIKSNPQHGILGNLKRDVKRVRERMQRPQYAQQREPAAEVSCCRLLARINEQQQAFEPALVELNQAWRLASQNRLDPELIDSITRDLETLQLKIKLSSQ